MNDKFQEIIVRVQNIYQDIMNNLVSNNIDQAKRKSWLLHELICTKFGNDYGKKEE